MKVYKRLRSRLIRSAILMLLAAAVLFAALNFLLHDELTALILSGGTFVVGALTLFLFYGNVRFELEVGRLRYYKFGRLRGNYFLSTCKFRTHIECDYDRFGNIIGKPELELFVSDVSDYSGNDVMLDCTPMGLDQFRDMIDSLRHYYESTAGREQQRLSMPELFLRNLKTH